MSVWNDREVVVSLRWPGEQQNQSSGWINNYENEIWDFQDKYNIMVSKIIISWREIGWKFFFKDHKLGLKPGC